MAVAVVDIQVNAAGATQQLRQFESQTQKASQAINNLKIDALQRSINALPGGLGLAANGIADFSRQINNAGVTAKATTAQIIALQAAIGSKKLQLAGAGGIGGEKIKAEIAGLESELGGLLNATKGVSPALLVAGASVIALGVGLAVGAGAALKFSNEIDRNRQQLTLFTKDVGVTNQIIAQLKVTADATSLGLPGLLEATKTLAAYGVSAKNAGTATKMLGDLALGDSEKLQRFAVNLGQISSIGKAYTVDLKQFAMAGIPIFEALSKVMGKSTSEVLKLAEQGQVTYPIVVKAIAELTKEGASFYNGAEKGGTDLDRSLNQLTGTFENLQTIVGTAVGPAVTQVIKGVKKSLEDVVLVIQLMQAELNKLKFPPGFIENGQKIGVFPRSFDQLTEGVKKTALSFNPLTSQLTNSINLFKILGTYYEKFGFGKNFAVPDKAAANTAKPSTATSEEAARQKYLADIAKKNTADVLADKLKKETEINGKIAKINKDKELQLGDARIQYERQISDFRQATLKRITDMERDLGDQRIKANFDLQQSNLKLAGQAQYGKTTDDILAAAASGRDTTMLEAARDSAKTLNDAAINRRQIEFDSTMKRIQLERTLTDFKKGIEREIGEMQKGYARQTGDILTKAGTNIQSAMIKGAQEVAAIMMRITTGRTPPPNPVLPAAAQPTNQQANSAAAGVGMVITPEMTRSRRAATLRLSDPATMAGRQGPLGSRADSVDAVNNIRQFSSPTAKLDNDTNELKRAAAEQKIKDIKIAQNAETQKLKDVTQQVYVQTQAGLKAATKKNETDQETLDLITKGINPALAAQFVQNEQLNAQNTLALDAQRLKVANSLEEEGLLADQLDQRKKLLANIDLQIAKQPQVLEGLNQQAIKQKQITDATQATVKAADDLKALYSDIGMSIKSSVIEGIQGAIDGTKRLQDVATDLLKKIADKLLDVAVNMALFGSMSGTGTGGGLLGGFFKSTPKAKAKGGSVTGGSPYLVGERGPELFMPGRSGGIAPAGSFGGGTNVVVNVDATGSNVQGDDQSSKQLGVLLAAAVQKELIKQKRPGGILA